jgi:hypothetical protein
MNMPPLPYLGRLPASTRGTTGIAMQIRLSGTISTRHW